MPPPTHTQACSSRSSRGSLPTWWTLSLPPTPAPASPTLRCASCTLRWAAWSAEHWRQGACSMQVRVAGWGGACGVCRVHTRARVSCCAGMHQAMRVRCRYLEAMLHQDMAFFDRWGAACHLLGAAGRGAGAVCARACAPPPAHLHTRAHVHPTCSGGWPAPQSFQAWMRMHWHSRRRSGASLVVGGGGAAHAPCRIACSATPTSPTTCLPRRVAQRPPGQLCAQQRAVHRWDGGGVCAGVGRGAGGAGE